LRNADHGCDAADDACDGADHTTDVMLGLIQQTPDPVDFPGVDVS
jgi:hypothetical protein